MNRFSWRIYFIGIGVCGAFMGCLNHAYNYVISEMDFDVFFRLAYETKIRKMKIGGMKKKGNSDDFDVESTKNWNEMKKKTILYGIQNNRNCSNNSNK